MKKMDDVRAASSRRRPRGARAQELGAISAHRPHGSGCIERSVDAITGGGTRGGGLDRAIFSSRIGAARRGKRRDNNANSYSPMTIFCWTAFGCSGCFSVSPMVLKVELRRASTSVPRCFLLSGNDVNTYLKSQWWCLVPPGNPGKHTMPSV